MGNNRQGCSTGVHKLSEATLPTIATSGRGIAVPTYWFRGDKPKPAIVHIGVGGFHRAHQAVYLDDLARQGIMDWGERGVGLLSGDKGLPSGDKRMAEALIPQDCLYTVVERNPEAEDTARVIGSMAEYLFAPDDPERVLDALADPATRIVSLTITEAGYNVKEATGEFDASHPQVQEDLKNPSTPQTVFGYICEALDRRRKAGEKPFTVLSCDNLPGNGSVAKTAFVSFADRRDKALAAWIEANAAFPNSMVDRITPQTTDADRAMVVETFGIADEWPVMTEPFKYAMWVIEIDPAWEENLPWVKLPPLEKVGVQFVEDVHPYDSMKLRLLNGSHSAMGYLGYLAGYDYIHEVMGDLDFRDFIWRLMDEEVRPLLPPVPRTDLREYQRTLIERFANPKIGDKVTRICQDGSAKMPKYLLPSLFEAVKLGRPHRLLTLAVAGWFRYLAGKDEKGEEIRIEDNGPIAGHLQELAKKGGQNPRPLLAERNLIDDPEIARALEPELEEALHDLYTLRARKTLTKYLALC